jgi:hypothetical protein
MANKEYYKIYNVTRDKFAKKGAAHSVKNAGYGASRMSKDELADSMFGKSGEIWHYSHHCADQLKYLKTLVSDHMIIIKYQLTPIESYIMLDDELVPNTEVGNLLYG